ncbi:dockerin type I domain-containing protein [Blastopirellula sp. J2-11]|uniref:dockerin type I domain-containing protein n=1 Tax=Blastopirellula sp. J2-11 TaxID=2943192 RepID=UPI0021C7C451|nr:dockerin type I domain-containing protein [Blastopirellula sp. J2-11]UUO08809.1 dockerin type I domain-containing protein [Blastopirellula sp. J2-11]
MEALEPRAMLAADLNAWHNPNMGLDVNDDQLVNDADLEIMLSQLEQGSRSFLQTSQAAGGLEGEQVLFLDVNNDGVFNPLDVARMLESLIEAEDADNSYSAAFNFEIKQGGMTIGKTSTGFDINDEPDPGMPVVIDVDQNVFTLIVTVRNTSAITGGNLATPDITGAYLDIGFDPLIVEADAPGTLGQYFNEGSVGTTVTGAGRIENAGGSSFTPDGAAQPGGWTVDQVLFTIDFMPTTTGTFTLEGLFANATVDNNNPDTKDVNQSAIVFQDLVDPDSGPLDVVNIAFPMITITVNAVNGANNDVVGASADLVDEIAADDPRVIDIDGEKYLVIDVKANDLDFNGNPLVLGAGVDLTLSANYGLDSLTTIADLESRVMVRTLADTPMPAIAGLSDQYIVYRLPTNFAGTEVFEYTLTDVNDSNNTNTATVTVKISPTVEAVDDLENGTPFATVLPGEMVTLDVLANDYIITDSGRVVAADQITITAISGTAETENRLAISADNKSLEYTGAALPGIESFTYTVLYTDDENVEHTDTATVTIRVPFNSLIAGGFYFDVNNDGVWNDNAGNSASPEQFIGGIEVGLYQNGVLVGTTFSSQADGSFSFAGIDAGAYSVKITPPKFVHPYGTGRGGVLPPNVSVMGDGSIMISNISITPSNLTPAAIGLGFVGRQAAYRGPNDSISGVGENSILFAVSKQPNNQGKLEWYSPDQGWDELISVEGFAFNSATKTGQAFLRIDHDNNTDTDPVVAGITFSLYDPNFLLIADTSDAVIFRLIGDIETIVDRLSNVDIAFEDF